MRSGCRRAAGNGRDAPIPAIRRVKVELGYPVFLKPTFATLFQPVAKATDCHREQGPALAVDINVEPRADHGMIRPERRSREVHK